MVLPVGPTKIWPSRVFATLMVLPVARGLGMGLGVVAMGAAVGW
jgi:hypothetical protein